MKMVATPSPNNTRDTIQCFEPIVGKDPVVLILGSMPGVASLTAGHYYAHPRNSFWKILADLLSFEPALAYEQRIAALIAARIALWDVINACRRPGSLDANIDHKDLIVNDFQQFFDTHTTIRQVFFNGVQAEQCYQRYVAPWLKISAMNYTRLPSTSPANASIPYAKKLEAWQVLLQNAKKI